MWLNGVKSASPAAAGLRRDGSASPVAAGLWRDRRFWHSFTLRLSFYYASAFVISAALLFALLYFLQAPLFDWRERDPIAKFLKRCVVAYEQHGAIVLATPITACGDDPPTAPCLDSVTFTRASVS